MVRPATLRDRSSIVFAPGTLDVLFGLRVDREGHVQERGLALGRGDDDLFRFRGFLGALILCQCRRAGDQERIREDRCEMSALHCTPPRIFGRGDVTTSNCP